MYKVSLEKSYFSAQADTSFRALTIANLLREQAGRAGSQVALREIFDDGSIGREWTYGHLLKDAERLGRALASRHAPGARIAVFATNCPEWILLELAAPLAGLTLITVNPSFLVRELRYVLQQSRSEAVYFVKSARGTVLGPIIKQACAELPMIKRSILVTDRKPYSMVKIVAIYARLFPTISFKSSTRRGQLAFRRARSCIKKDSYRAVLTWSRAGACALAIQFST